MTTLLLSDDWDLTVDTRGNIASVNGPYAIAQDVASAARLFLGELWYDTTQGVPYLEAILGKMPPAGFIVAQLQAAALSVPHVIKAVASVSLDGPTRVLSGNITITDDRGQVSTTGGPLTPGVPWYVNAADFTATRQAGYAPVTTDSDDVLTTDFGTPIVGP